MKRKIDQWRQQEYDIDGIGKSLLVFGIVRPSRIERSPVVSFLNFYRDVVAVGIPVVPQQFARSRPAWVRIGQVAARTVAACRVRDVIAEQDSVDGGPHAGRRR